MTAAQGHQLRKGDRTRLRLKKAAMKLFALHGLDNVSIRDIQSAAGQKNNGSITYYFSSRDALIREMVGDVAKVLDEDNNRRLDAIEAREGPTSVREAVEILLPVIDAPEDHGEDWQFQLQFFTSVMISRRDLLFEATTDTDRATRRCCQHILRLVPGIPDEIMRQRLQLVLLFALSAGSSMQAGREDHRNWASLWGQPSSEPNLVDMMAGMLLAPISGQTRDTLGRPRAAPPPATGDPEDTA